MNRLHVLLGVAAGLALTAVFYPWSNRPAMAAPPASPTEAQGAPTQKADTKKEPPAARSEADQPAPEADGGEKDAPSWVKHEDGKKFIELDAETQERIGLAVETLRTTQSQPEFKAYGALEEDPADTFTLRAPYPGYVMASSQNAWPKLGTRVAASGPIGELQVRLTAVERLDIQSRRLDAQGEINELQADLESARASFDNKRRLNEQGKVVSDRAMEEAETKVRVDEARLASAREKKALFDRLIGGDDKSIETIPLTTPMDGEIVSVLVGPGEAVESGQPILRIARFKTLIARIELPVGRNPGNLTGSAMISTIGGDGHVSEATLIGRAPMVGMETRGLSLLFDVQSNDDRLRPGMPVVAHLKAGGAAADGVLIPRSAMLRFAGSTRVYVQTGDERFESRDIFPESPTIEGWFADSGVAPGERIVVKGAQVLLSEELKAQIEQEAEAEE